MKTLLPFTKLKARFNRHAYLRHQIKAVVEQELYVGIKPRFKMFQSLKNLHPNFLQQKGKKKKAASEGLHIISGKQSILLLNLILYSLIHD